MKKLILMGRTGCGKTTLTQALKGEKICYHKTQYVNHFDVVIDTPGEYIETKHLGGALAVYSYEADVVGLLIAANEPFSLYPPNITSMVNREVVSRGYLTQCGICHRSEYNQFNFSCDLMEPFRPIVDRLAYEYAQELFDQDVRRLLGDLGNRVVTYKGGSYRLHSVVSLFVQDCLAALNKNVAPSKIEGFEQ